MRQTPSRKRLVDAKLPRVQEQTTHATLPRVVATPTITSKELPKMPSIVLFLDSEFNESPPRKLHVTKTCTPISTIFSPSTLPKNVRINNSSTHSYNLRSKPALVLQHMHSSSTADDSCIAQHIFNLQLLAYHIFKEDGTKETLDSLLAGKQRPT